MLNYFYRNNCTLEELNATRTEHDHPYVETEKFNALIVLPLACVALVANSLSLHIFCRQPFDNKAVRFSLLSISIIEILLQISLITETIIVRTDFEHWHTVFSYIFTSLTHTCINAFVSIRNWCVLLISSARCEVIVRPLASRRFLLFTRCRLAIMLATVIIIAFGLALLATFISDGVICTNLIDPETGSNAVLIVQSILMRDKKHSRFIPEAIFIYQSLMTVLLIPIPTLIMWIKLRQSIMPTRRHSNVNGTTIVQDSFMTRRALASQRASQMVFGLGLLFCVMEVPTFITTVILRNFPHLPDKLPFHPDTITNVLSVSDSFLNFFVYAASSARFRRDFNKLLNQMTCKIFTKSSEAKENGVSDCSTQLLGVPPNNNIKLKIVSSTRNLLEPNKGCECEKPTITYTDCEKVSSL